jgi:uncharacterized RDD family membrane protein YckC
MSITSKRIWAYFIDLIFVFALFYLLHLFVGKSEHIETISIIPGTNTFQHIKTFSFAPASLDFSLLNILFFHILLIIYFTVLESSKWQASFGKKIMGLILSDAKGNRLGFWMCFKSAFVFQIIWWLEMIIGARSPKQEFLHDLIFEYTKVINKQ